MKDSFEGLKYTDLVAPLVPPQNVHFNPALAEYVKGLLECRIELLVQRGEPTLFSGVLTIEEQFDVLTREIADIDRRIDLAMGARKP